MMAWKIKSTSNFPLVILLLPLLHIHCWYQYMSVFKQIIMIFPHQGILLFLLLNIDIFLLYIPFESGWVMNKMSIDISLQNKLTTFFQGAVLGHSTEFLKGSLGKMCGQDCCRRSPRGRRRAEERWERVKQSPTTPVKMSHEQGLILMGQTQYRWICGAHWIDQEVLWC